MSEKEKSGEGLIEQAEETVAQDVEKKEQESTEEEIPAFDPKAFSEAEESEGDDLISEAESKVEEQSSDEFDWGSVEVDYENEEEPQQEEEEEDWDSVPESNVEEGSKDEPFDWSVLAKELDLNAKDENSFKQAVKKAMSKPAPVNDTIDTLQSFLKQSDANLVASDLKASGLTKEEVTDTIERLQDSGLLKREAIMIRKNLQN